MNNWERNGSSRGKSGNGNPHFTRNNDGHFHPLNRDASPSDGGNLLAPSSPRSAHQGKSTWTNPPSARCNPKHVPIGTSPGLTLNAPPMTTPLSLPLPTPLSLPLLLSGQCPDLFSGVVAMDNTTLLSLQSGITVVPYLYFRGLLDTGCPNLLFTETISMKGSLQALSTPHAHVPPCHDRGMASIPPRTLASTDSPV